jgi:hypothetical protein
MIGLVLFWVFAGVLVWVVGALATTKVAYRIEFIDYYSDPVFVGIVVMAWPGFACVGAAVGAAWLLGQAAMWVDEHSG